MKRMNGKFSGDFKVMGLLLGMQISFTKFFCFICGWESEAKGKHYEMRECKGCFNSGRKEC